MLWFCIAVTSSLVLLVHAASRTSPPPGAIVIRAGTTSPGEFTSITSGIASLPNDSSSQSIFIYPGTYTEQVLIDRSGEVTIYGYTDDVMNFAENQAVLTHSASLGTAGSDDASGTLRIMSDNVALYNIDVRNDFGVSKSNGQAIALSNYGSSFGAYACRFYSYQGAVDFIFGRQGQAYFEGNTITSKGAGCITASGREANDSSIYIFNQNQVIAASDAFSNVTGNVYLGRPWGDYAKVVFKNTVIGSQLNKAVWSEWNTGDPRTDHVLFAEYNSTGAGVQDANRPSFATILTSSEDVDYTISTAVGSNYISWVNSDYLA
ncbi:pectin lyase fold/virulence factor [Phellopilus nigrolimitatus]|nr:pectin lyase fold/virulence factor [Phellopilus nigrolimitatus]